jgi:hypothetical protein
MFDIDKEMKDLEPFLAKETLSQEDTLVVLEALNRMAKELLRLVDGLCSGGEMGIYTRLKT